MGRRNRNRSGLVGKKPEIKAMSRKAAAAIVESVSPQKMEEFAAEMAAAKEVRAAAAKKAEAAARTDENYLIISTATQANWAIRAITALAQLFSSMLSVAFGNRSNLTDRGVSSPATPHIDLTVSAKGVGAVDGVKTKKGPEESGKSFEGDARSFYDADAMEEPLPKKGEPYNTKVFSADVAGSSAKKGPQVGRGEDGEGDSGPRIPGEGD